MKKILITLCSLELAFASSPRLTAGANSQCADDRVASADNRIGRTDCGTAWLVSNGAVLTAGHCAPASGVFEVNIPPSMADGTEVPSAPQDQFPILAAGQQSEFHDPEAGSDWAVFSIGPNALGERAHVKFGFFRLTRQRPSPGTTVRVTGCGVDSSPPGSAGGENAQSTTLQTSTSSFTSESITPTYSRINCTGEAEEGNSGGPYIWEANGWAFGIITRGKCFDIGPRNSGTSFEHDPLENALNGFFGATTVHLDWATGPNNPPPSGSILQPYHNLNTATAAVPPGGTVRIVSGNYSASGGNNGTYNQPMTLVAPVGPVTIGTP